MTHDAGGAATTTATEPELAEVDAGVEQGHGSESFFVVGEGLIGEARGGRAHAAVAAAAASTPKFRFSRVGPKGKPNTKAVRKAVAKAMTAGGGGDSGIPAGYTYLGQFIDHDLTFDRTDVALGTDITPGEMKQARSPALDLDSLYGAGPDERGLQALLPRRRPAPADGPHRGRRQRAAGRPRRVRPAAQRRAQARDDPGSAQRREPRRRPDPPRVRALPQPRARHARLRAGRDRFKEARRLVVKHYQWMIRHDYLPRICEASVVDDVFTNGRKIFEVGAGADQVPTMPIEFSVAAFRLGHSMIRRDYNWNKEFDDGSGALFLLFAFSGTSGDLGNGVRLPSNWIADWRRLYEFEQAALQVPANKFNRARRIDTLLSNPLKELPPGSFGAKQPPGDAIEANLAFRNLARAKMVELATGQGMAARLQSKGVAVTPLTKAQIRDGAGGATLSGLSAQERTAFLDHTPLWFYILREAELNGGKLTGVGARIVAETIHRAIQGSRFSIMKDTAFKPSLGPNAPAKFDMRDLLFFAFEGKKALLAPLG